MFPMPDQRLERTRATLPDDYRFGDAAPLGRETREFFERRKQRFIEAEGLQAWEADRQRRADEASQAADDADDARDW